MQKKVKLNLKKGKKGKSNISAICLRIYTFYKKYFFVNKSKYKSLDLLNLNAHKKLNYTFLF